MIIMHCRRQVKDSEEKVVIAASVASAGRSLKKSSPPDTNKTDTEGSLEETCKLVTEAQAHQSVILQLMCV